VVVVDPKGKYEALEKYGFDLIKMAKQGKLNPIIGHDEDIQRNIQIVFREHKTILYSLVSLV
jgi:ATP-dependent Clp protease ATP-binding subunit ClpB